MKVRIGALEIEVDTKEQLDELVMRYGAATVAVVDSPVSRAAEPPRCLPELYLTERQAAIAGPKPRPEAGTL